jgi:hypothetical protein
MMPGKEFTPEEAVRPPLSDRDRRGYRHEKFRAQGTS